LKSTRVLLLDNTVIVVHDPAIFSVENLTTAINDQGFEVEDASSKPLSPAPGARGGKKKAVAQAAAAVATPAPSSAAATTGTKNASSFRPEKWSVLLSIEGMTCSSCTGTIENGLKDAQGISDVRVDLMSNSATLTVTSLGLAEDAAKHITKMGYPAQVMTVGSISTPGKKISSIQPADAKNHITTTPEKWAVLLSIEGMTCSSCTGTIENGLKGHSGVIDVKVDLMSNSATLVVTNREMAESAAEAVGELGYPAQVTSVELLSGGRAEKRQKATKIIPPGYKALFLIGGMTCSSCVNTISNGIRGIAGVSDFEVDLMAQSGSGNITDESLAQKIKEDIRDLGYEAEILKVEPLASAGDDVDGDEVEPKPRNVSIRIDGLFCEKCPPRVNKVLEEFSIKFDDLSYTPVTLDDPSATLTYIPRPPEFSLRIVKLAIQELGFTMNVLQAETLQDRAMRVQKKERQRLLIRLMVAIVFCIPTFIFGVVGPSLLSASNGFRRYLETPIAGGAARFKIALLVLSTPVQFGVGSLFYTHSYKSLRGVWRKRGGKISKRKVWLDRLFRWGSMDSLVALGTTIAWVSSLAYLALDIRGTGMSSEMGFFDTSVFLITFILAGRYLVSLRFLGFTSMGHLRRTDS
jgi:copper ion binding protein